MNQNIRRRVLKTAVALAVTSMLPFAASPVFAQVAASPRSRSS